MSEQKGSGCLPILVGAGIYLAYRLLMPASVSVEYLESPKREHQVWQQYFTENQWLSPLADAVNRDFDLPRDLHVVTMDCGEPNAFYDPATTSIVICYELVDRLARDYARRVKSDSLIANAVWQTTAFIFYHEVGHALVDLKQLPVTGREEDAVDQLATLVLLDAGDYGRDSALRGAEWFDGPRSTRGTRQPMWDEHSLSQQRYYNILCWVYGSNPEAHAALLTRDWGLPAERAERCPTEYTRMREAWNSLLAD